MSVPVRSCKSLSLFVCPRFRFLTVLTWPFVDDGAPFIHLVRGSLHEDVVEGGRRLRAVRGVSAGIGGGWRGGGRCCLFFGV